MDSIAGVIRSRIMRDVPHKDTMLKLTFRWALHHVGLQCCLHLWSLSGNPS